VAPDAPLPTASCPDENALGGLADAMLDDAARRALESHLDGCAACSRLVAELARLAPPLRAAPERYAVVRRLGAGGMGEVWEAEDRQLHRRVALKWVLPDPAIDPAGDHERRARLYREARALARLRHRHVLAVHDVGEIDDVVYVVLELVEGMTARAWRAAAPRTPDEILAVWRMAGAGLAAVHRAGIVHRDVKPDNVLVADDERVLLGDFGLATAPGGDAMTALTSTGQVLGTPLYMAPEQLRGEPATARSDQFALCVCLWEALAGVRPFAGATTAALAVAMLDEPAVPGHVDRRVFAVLARGLAAKPEARWPDVDALLAALAAPPVAPRRAALGLAALAAGAVVALAAWLALRTPAAKAPQLVAVARSVPDTAEQPPAIAAPATHDASARPDQAQDATPPADATAPGPRARTAGAANPVGPRSAPGGGDPGDANRAAAIAWAHDEASVTRLLQAGDGRGCLAALDKVHTREPYHRDDLARYRAMCIMLAGDCAAGRTAMEQALTDSWAKPAPGHLTEAVDRYDAEYCPLDAPPETRWPERAMAQLRHADAAGSSCAPVLAFVDAHHLPLPQIEMLRVTCLVNVGDCDGARAAWRAHALAARLIPRDAADPTAEADRRFATLHPRCAP